MQTEYLAAEALLLALEDSVSQGAPSGIRFESWDRVFSDGGPLLTALIPFHSQAPFRGLNLPSREQVQLVYETYRSRLQVISWMPPMQAYRQALLSDQIFPQGLAAFAMRPPALDALSELLRNEFAV
jgi:hypothetical protein